MLNCLTIRDIVLIDNLELRLAPGLCVLTGETGAGKSILLDALGLAIGRRGERSLVRHGAAQGVVTAEFQLNPDHAAWSLVAEQGLEGNSRDGLLILRRLVGEDGRSRAFVNDQPISIGLLGRLGDTLVEVHGQHDDRGLFNPAGHRTLLDAYGRLEQVTGAVEQAHAIWLDACAAQDKARSRHDAVKRDEDYIRHNLEELVQLDPQAGEEGALAERRAFMMKGEKAAENLADILTGLTTEAGVDARLRGALRKAEQLAGMLGDMAEPAIEALDRAAVETTEAVARLEELSHRLEYDPASLDKTEGRLFALRAAARKHQVMCDDLPALRLSFEEKLQALDDGSQDLARLEREQGALRMAFEEKVTELSAARHRVSKVMDREVNAELASLKLEKARFRTRIDDLPPEQWGGEGGNRVEFEVATNSGAPFGPLMKIASGGELSRFILALKVVLARQGTAPTLVFDEVDRGIGGAVADAVGERLARLATEAQVLVVTHSPQVAALGGHHWRIIKLVEDDGTSKDEHVVTRVVPLGQPDRREEIARMLAGAKITDEARAAAMRLMQRQET